MKAIASNIILFLFLSTVLSGQAIYNGHVQDVANGADIVDVKVELLNSNIETYTNSFGDFIIENGGLDSIPLAADIYRFYNNSMIWEGELDVSIELFAVDGRLVFQKSNLGNAGTFLFPRFDVGIYLLRVSTKADQHVFKAFSDGSVTSIADSRAEWHRSTVRERSDTLLLTKEGYYPREVVMTGRDSFFKVNLLKGDNEDVDYFNELLAPVAYELISSTPSRTNDGKVASVKIIYNEDDDLMYYMNTKKHQYHFTFATRFLGFDQGNFVFNQTQYLENDNRYLYPANLNYYESLDLYVLYLVSANEMSCENIKRLYDKIIETSYLEGKLVLFNNRAEFNFCDIPKISPEELYKGQNYQALNLTENYGYLNKVEIEDLESSYLGRHDIVLLNGIPNDVSVVAGIITTEFQTPLSHINVLSHNRGTPNMALRDGWENEQLENLLGELVYLNVQSDSFEIRKASLVEAEAFWASKEPQEIIELEKNTNLQGLVDLNSANYSYVDRIGGKASNFAEILKVELNGQTIPTPESSFAVPFYYYDQHIKAAGLESFISEMLQDEEFINNPASRKARLEDLQDRIKNFPIDTELLQLVKNRINNFEEFTAFRFRSSTNAEDLESFSGAGLYSSYSAKKDHATKTIDNAIKKVWASLWNWRAFEERSYYKIVHESCAMGILVHRSFPDEDANGVVVTKNLYNENPGFIINVQFKEYSIVFPEPGVLNDQLILFAWSNVPGQQFMPEYLTFSNIPEFNGRRVMTDEELHELGEYCMELKKHFYDNVPDNCNCDFNDFGLDIEFKVDSQVSPRKIYIKQARYYK